MTEKNIKVEKITEVKYRTEAKGPKHHVGVYTETGDWINVNCFSKEDLEKIMKGVEVGGAYQVTLEGKYDNVKSFERINAEEPAVKASRSMGKTESAVKEAPLTTQKSVDTDRKIVRQSCLKAAAVANPKGIPVEELTNYAAELEKWVYR